MRLTGLVGAAGNYQCDDSGDFIERLPGGWAASGDEVVIQQDMELRSIEEDAQPIRHLGFIHGWVCGPSSNATYDTYWLW